AASVPLAQPRPGNSGVRKQKPSASASVPTHAFCDAHTSFEHDRTYQARANPVAGHSVGAQSSEFVHASPSCRLGRCKPVTPRSAPSSTQRIVLSACGSGGGGVYDGTCSA